MISTDHRLMAPTIRMTESIATQLHEICLAFHACQTSDLRTQSLMLFQGA